MSLSAATIFADAPLGAIIRWSDGTPRPPSRHVRKVRDWERSNGEGRLVERHTGSGPRMPGSFTVHEGDFGEGGVIILSVRRVFGVNSGLHFEIASVPQPGEALVITSSLGHDALEHVARDDAAAERWRAAHGYQDARIDIVPSIAIAA
ncbi:hypothetical protein QLH51_05710 [Sphingomonas sp. 2R-10]|uniref:hypothetical protein n=1 Tax=Sphingomonas sp. 2R-10 TaxID=3045148 RepID=UPI000F785C37|nr:hypothetical protein [Sphingomonas sp. 2R-10]MDJ0276293.1 hypothetical protein [Sphingomonas sp. 2R-10]